MPVVTIPQSGVGISLAYKIPPATTFTSLVWLEDDCEFSGFENNVIEIKPLASNTVTKVGGRSDYGSFTGSVYLVASEASVQGLFALGVSKALVSWQLQLPDGTLGATPPTGTLYTFSGFVSSVKPGGFSGEDAPSVDFEIAISGVVTIVPAT
jgi:hypothetical protein